MLGRRSPQRSLFDGLVLPHRVPADASYDHIDCLRGVLSPDDDLAATYCADRGRSSLPPSLLNGMLLFYEDGSDEESASFHVPSKGQGLRSGALFDDLIRGAAKWRPRPTGCQAGRGARTTS